MRQWTYSSDHNGYMIYFNGRAVGGAGTIGRAKRSAANLHFHHEQGGIKLRECLARDRNKKTRFDPARFANIWEWFKS